MGSLTEKYQIYNEQYPGSINSYFTNKQPNRTCTNHSLKQNFVSKTSPN